MLKSNKGITGIALTITITVLAILAVVTISAVMNTGLIDVTKKVKEDYEQAEQEEVNRESELKNFKNGKYAESEKNSSSLNINDNESLLLKNYRIYGRSVQDTDNLFKVSTITTGKYYDAAGTLTDNTGVFISDYIQVIESARYNISGSNTASTTQNLIINFFDENKNWVSQSIVECKASSKYNNEFVIPSGISYISCSFALVNKNNVEIKAMPSPTNQIEIQSVGEYDKTRNKYKIPVTVTGKNLMPETTFAKTYGPYNGISSTYEGNGIFHIYGEYTNNTTGGVSGHAFQTNLNIPFEDPTAKYTLSATLLSGSFSGSNLYPYIGTYSDTVSHKNWLDTVVKPTTAVGQTVSNTLTGNYYTSDAKGMTRFWIYWSVASGKTFTIDCRIQVWLEKNSSSTAYEPYKGITTNIYLDEPLRSIGNYADYIDFKEQKVVRKVKEIVFNGTENIYKNNTYYNSYGYDGFAYQLSDTANTLYFTNWGNYNPEMSNYFITTGTYSPQLKINSFNINKERNTFVFRFSKRYI